MKNDNIIARNKEGDSILFSETIKEHEINKDMLIIGTAGKGVNIRYDENGNRYINGKLKN